MNEYNYDVVVIGGGPAGMASALAAEKEGAKVLILERNIVLGGILVQCIHNGFGLHYFKEELTGPEYAAKNVKMVKESNIDVMLDTMVIDIFSNKKIIAINPKNGYMEIYAKAIVLAMGCRERAAGAIQLCGTRPAGIYTAGAAQRIVNIEGYKIGRKVVILGSGDIGLIMARRMTFEGAKVECVCELMPYSSGLKRNIAQCLNDFDIPLYFSTTVTRVIGKEKLEGIFIAPVDKNRRPILTEEKFIECGTLLLSVGLIPENDLVAPLNMKMDNVTTGAVVNEFRETSIKGIFAAGNVLHVHDLVDNVSMEGEIAGKSAAEYALDKMEKEGKKIKVKTKNGIRYALPQIIHTGDKKVKIYFRVGDVYKDIRLNVTSNGEIIYAKKFPVLAPGEMGNIILDVKEIDDDIELSLEVIE